VGAIAGLSLAVLPIDRRGRLDPGVGSILPWGRAAGSGAITLRVDIQRGQEGGGHVERMRTEAATVLERRGVLTRLPAQAELLEGNRLQPFTVAEKLGEPVAVVVQSIGPAAPPTVLQIDPN